MFDTDADYETHTNFKDPHHHRTIDVVDPDEIDPIDESEMLMPKHPYRQKRTMVFRPLFVYRQQELKKTRIAAERRNSGHRRQHTAGRSHSHGHEHGHA